jgi:heme/copper-type cytochrome/quinol oxidase subunit 4
MLELDKMEMIIRYSAIGFVLGVALTILEYALLLYAP